MGYANSLRTAAFTWLPFVFFGIDIHTSEGIQPPFFISEMNGMGYAPSPYVEILTPVLPKLTVFSGLSHPGVDGGRANEICILSGALHPAGAGFRDTVSLDQIAAEKVDSETRLTLLVVGMDPPGFAFENYDSLGRWRDKDGNLKIDVSATLPEGKTFDGVPVLKSYLLANQDAFARCVTEKLLTYDLGRGVEPFDTRAVDAITEAVKNDQYRLSRIVVAIVTSHPFRFGSSIPGERP